MDAFIMGNGGMVSIWIMHDTRYRIGIKDYKLLRVS